MTNLNIEGYTYSRDLHIGKNSFLFEAINNTSGLINVIKVKNYSSEEQFTKDIHKESKMLKSLETIKGFPKMMNAIQTGQSIAIIMEKLGPSLEELLGFMKGRFSLKTSLLLFDQMLVLVQELQNKGFVHGNLKPNHFLIGKNDERDVVFLVDFEYVLNKRDSTQKPELGHLDFDFTSTNYLAEKSVSWKDDIESLAYILIYFLQGVFPWSDKLESKHGEKTSDQQKISDLKKCYFMEKKFIPVELLCFGLPCFLKSRNHSIG